MPKRPVSELTPSLEIHDFFSSNFFRVQENLRDLTVTQIRELISILLKHDFTSRHSPINLASISLLLNKMLSPALSHEIDLEDYSNICSVLSVLCQLQRNDDVISTVDPKTVIQFLIKIAEQNTPELSAYAIEQLKKAHEVGLLYRPYSSAFVCHLHGALNNFIHSSALSSQSDEYLMNLIYLFEVKVLSHSNSASILASIRASLRSTAVGHSSSVSIISTVQRQPLSTQLPAQASSVSGFTERARPHKVPAPIITNLDLVLHQPAMTTAPVLAPVVRQPSVVEMNRARRLARFNRITTALQTGNIALIEGLFEEMNVTIKESPTHAPNPGQPRRRVVGFLFLDTTPAARLAPAGDVTPRTPQSSAEMKEAANLICAYLKRSLSSVEKLQFIELIKHSNAELFSTLFFPFRTNRKELYSLVEANGVDQIIKHIPIDELSKFINCLAGPGGLRIKQSADSLVVVLQCLYRRVERHPQRANTIAPIFRRLIDDARTYHETKNTFDKMIGHPEVLRRIRREEVAFDLLIQVNSANIPVL